MKTYKAKQAADTFGRQSRDVMAAALVWVGTTVLGVGDPARSSPSPIWCS
jgi:hypothetical protein